MTIARKADPAVLKQHLQPLSDWSYPGVQSESEIVLQRKRELAERVSALFDVYGIDLNQDDRWYWLAMFLAFEHERSFKRHIGRGKSWTFLDRWRLHHAVLLVRRRQGSKREKRSEVFNLLAGNDDPRFKRFKCLAPKTLRMTFEESEDAFNCILHERRKQRAEGRRRFAPQIGRQEHETFIVPSTAEAMDALVRELRDR